VVFLSSKNTVHLVITCQVLRGRLSPPLGLSLFCQQCPELGAASPASASQGPWPPSAVGARSPALEPQPQRGKARLPAADRRTPCHLTTVATCFSHTALSPRKTFSLPFLLSSRVFFLYFSKCLHVLPTQLKSYLHTNIFLKNHRKHHKSIIKKSEYVVTPESPSSSAPLDGYVVTSPNLHLLGSHPPSSTPTIPWTC
jgi:hypothetical protein